MLQNVHFGAVAFCQLVGIPFDLFDMIVFILNRCWWAKFWRPGSQSLSDQKTEARVWSESLVRKGIEPYNNADYSVFIKSWCWLCYSGIYYPKTHTIQTSNNRNGSKISTPIKNMCSIFTHCTRPIQFKVSHLSVSTSWSEIREKLNFTQFRLQ